MDKTCVDTPFTQDSPKVRLSDENYFNLESAGTTLERWQVWKKGFDSAHSDDTVSEEVRHVAARAFALMDTLDKTMF